ncbi:MAG TPA: FGLLP motif-containing membrane protein [Candidatus Saccharimonadales bacterium]|nr:FGLLP motif-containing membrane protein [Candidatus Saccharimonadales bacterium]
MEAGTRTPGNRGNSWAGDARSRRTGSLTATVLTVIVVVAAVLALVALLATPRAVAGAVCTPIDPPHTIYPSRPPSTNPEVVAVVPVGKVASTVAVDGTGTTGRVFAPDDAGNTIAVIDGRPSDPSLIRVISTITVGLYPLGLAIDSSNGRMFVANLGSCSVSVVDTRGATPAVIDTIPVDGHPTRVAVDPSTHRVFVSLQDVDRVAVLELQNDRYHVTTMLDVPIAPGFLLLDPARGLLLVAAQGNVTGVDTGLGSLAVIDARAMPLPILLPTRLPLSAPAGMALDPETGLVYVVENGEDRIATVRLGTDGSPQLVARIPADNAIDAGRDRNPVDLVFLPRRRELLVTLYPALTAGQPRLNTFAVDASGGLTPAAPISGIDRATGIALDPVSGRVFVAEREAGRVTVLNAEIPSPLELPFVLPGPFDISFNPIDVARSFGLMLFLMLLVGAPTQLFNGTLESNMEDVRSVFRMDRLPHPPIPSWVWRTWAGAGLYLLVAAVVYAFLDPSFPGPDWPLVLWTGVLGLAVGTLMMSLPGDLYVRHRFHGRGTVLVAQWTIFLAAACVILTRVTGAQPGYVYGIIGALVFSMPLTLKDEGRMAMAGGVALLVLALVAWFLRIPFQPAVGELPSGPALVIDKALATVFIEAISALVFGLIPLRFLAGHVLKRWNTRAWLLLWGVSILIFAHVILYPVSDYQPNPSAVGIWTVVITVGVYAAIAVLFWDHFRRREKRREALEGPAGEEEELVGFGIIGRDEADAPAFQAPEATALATDSVETAANARAKVNELADT